jgi:hypothetical protein
MRFIRRSPLGVDYNQWIKIVLEEKEIKSTLKGKTTVPSYSSRISDK